MRAKMADREVELGRDLRQWKFSAEVGLEPFAGTLRLPRGKAAARRFGEPPKSTIGLRDMRGKCQHHVIDEKLVDLVRPT